MFVLFLNSLLNDWECSNPNANAISLIDNSVVDSFSFAFDISFSWICCWVFCPVSALAGYLSNLMKRGVALLHIAPLVILLK